MHASSRPCPNCSSLIPSQASAGVCPRCALAAAADPQESGAVRSPKPPAIEDVVAAFPGREFQGFLGAGAMGFVYKVRDLASCEIGALKVLRPELVADPAFLERFER